MGRLIIPIDRDPRLVHLKTALAESRLVLDLSKQALPLEVKRALCEAIDAFATPADATMNVTPGRNTIRIIRYKDSLTRHEDTVIHRYGMQFMCAVNGVWYADQPYILKDTIEDLSATALIMAMETMNRHLVESDPHFCYA